MDMKKIQELPTPEDLKKEFPLPYKVQKIKKQRDQEIEDIFTGKDDRLILINCCPVHIIRWLCHRAPSPWLP